MAFTSLASVIGLLCVVGELSCAVAMLFVVSENLWHVTVFSTSISTTVYGQCFIQSDYTNVWSSTCNYAYSLASFSILMTFFMSLAGACSRQPGARIRMALYNSVILFVWWVVGASIITNSITGANDADVPQEYWRQVMLGLLWAEVGMFAISIFTDWKQLDAFVHTVERSQQLYTNDQNQPTGSMYAQSPQPVFNTYPPPSAYPYPSGYYAPQVGIQPSPFANAQVQATQAAIV